MPRSPNRLRNRSCIWALLVLLVFAGLWLTYAQERSGPLNPDQLADRTSDLSTEQHPELPRWEMGDPVYEYPGFTLWYDEETEQARWVAYELTAEEALSTEAERTDRFLRDPHIATGSADGEDYHKSGYDRGHLAPAADMRFSREAMEASFYYSNMSPQVPAFNRGIWARLEAQVRSWAIENGTLLVVTGPLFSDDRSIGPKRVAVPSAYFKVLLDYTEPEIKGAAFVLSNEGSNQALSFFFVSIDEVERLSGLDFFPFLPDETEAALESRRDPEPWFSSVPVPALVPVSAPVSAPVSDPVPVSATPPEPAPQE